MATLHTPEQTFRRYTASQAAAYALGRGTYPPALYSEILSHHASTGGGFDTLLDVGCGHGNATRDIAAAFTQAIGTDGSAEMINTASSIGGKTQSGEPVRYEVCDAEDIDHLDGLQAGSVDLITAAMAAHWFDMPRFWTAASKILKPRGTVALWTAASLYCHPSVANYEKIQEILFDQERVQLTPYALPGNVLSGEGYTKLLLPWTISPPAADFDEADFVRRDWNRDGKCEKLKDGTWEDFLIGSTKQTVETFERGCDTASMVTRWREVNSVKVERGEVEDVLKRTVRMLKEIVGEEGTLWTGGWTALLMVKKK